MPAATEAGDEADRFGDAPHPRATTKLIGHSDHEQALLHGYRAGRLPHAMIIGGPQGIGKATLAWRLTRFMLANPDPDGRVVADAERLDVPAGSKAAAEVASLSHPDIALLRREVNDKTKRFFTEIRTDDVRRAIGLFQRGAAAGGHRICIVDSAEDLNRSSANALLKLIEEPPPRSLFLLIAHRPGLVLPTIRSRTRLLRLAPLAPADVETVVSGLGPPWSSLPAEQRAAASAQARGSVREALRLLQHRGVELDRAVAHLLDSLPAVEWRSLHKLAEQVVGRDGEAAYAIVLQLVFDWLAGEVQRRAGQGARQLAPLADCWERLAAQARETEALNLDKRSFILGTFADLAAAVRAASA